MDLVRLLKNKITSNDDDLILLQCKMLGNNVSPRFQIEVLKESSKRNLYLESMNEIAISLLEVYPREALTVLYDHSNGPFEFLELFSTCQIEYEDWIKIYAFLQDKIVNYELLLDDPLFVALLTKSLELKSTDLVKFCFLSRSIAIKAMEIVTTMETSSFKVNLICDLIFFFPELQNEIVLPDKWDSSNISSFGRLLLHGILNEPETHIISFTELLFSEQIELKPILKEFFGQYQDRHQIDLANTIIVHFVTTFESSILEKELHSNHCFQHFGQYPIHHSETGGDHLV
jgi:hypothetical protein